MSDPLEHAAPHRPTNTPGPDVQTVFRSPEWFLRELDFARGLAHFVPLPKSAYSALSFLDLRHVPATGQCALPIQRLLAESTAAPRVPSARGFILHIGFCGSTLLTRLLERPGRSMVLREPAALHQVAWLKRQLDASAEPRAEQLIRQMLGLVLRLQERTFNDAEHIVIKPSDSCLNLARLILDLRPETRIVLMHIPLDEFIVSVLKSDRRRMFIRDMLARVRSDTPQLIEAVPKSEDSLTDAEAGALLWCSSMHMIHRTLNSKDERMMALNGADLFAEPARCTLLANDFLRLGFNAHEVAEQAHGNAMERDAKVRSSTASSEERAGERRRRRLRLEPEITAARSFLETLPPDHRPPEASWSTPFT